VKALLKDWNDDLVWHTLSANGGGIICGLKYSVKDCLKQVTTAQAFQRKKRAKEAKHRRDCDTIDRLSRLV